MRCQKKNSGNFGASQAGRMRSRTWAMAARTGSGKLRWLSGQASMQARQPMHYEGSFTRMLKGSMMSIGQTSAQRPHMRQTGSGMGTKPVFG